MSAYISSPYSPYVIVLLVIALYCDILTSHDLN